MATMWTSELVARLSYISRAGRSSDENSSELFEEWEYLFTGNGSWTYMLDRRCIFLITFHCRSQKRPGPFSLVALGPHIAQVLQNKEATIRLAQLCTLLVIRSGQTYLRRADATYNIDGVSEAVSSIMKLLVVGAPELSYTFSITLQERRGRHF